jgi:hypothetical protein
MPEIPGRVPNPVSGLFANLRRLLVYAAGCMATVLMLAAAPQRAEALSLASPGAVPLSAKYASDGLITEVRHGGGGGHGGGFHGGGGFRGFHGGGFRGFHGGFHRGGFVGRHHWGGYRRFGGWHRPYWRGRHFVHRRFYGGYYPYAYGPRCRVVWTYYGPRRICRYRPWVHRHYRWHRRVWW